MSDRPDAPSGLLRPIVAAAMLLPAAPGLAGPPGNGMKAPSVTYVGRSWVAGQLDPTVRLPVPTGVHVGDLLVAVLAGPPVEPGHPWRPPAGWTFIDQVVHMGRFWRIADATDARAGAIHTFVAPAPPTIYLATMTAFRGVDRSDPIVDTSGVPVCQVQHDSLCRGRDGNPPNPECWVVGCSVFAAPSVHTAGPGTMLLGTWFSHIHAAWIFLPAGFAKEMREDVQGMVQGIIGVTGHRLAPGGEGQSGDQVAAPFRGTAWDHAIAGLLAIRPA